MIDHDWVTMGSRHLNQTDVWIYCKCIRVSDIRLTLWFIFVTVKNDFYGSGEEEIKDGINPRYGTETHKGQEQQGGRSTNLFWTQDTPPRYDDDERTQGGVHDSGDAERRVDTGPESMRKGEHSEQ